MADEPNPRRLKRDQYSPKPATLASRKVSGNPINGLGEAAQRRPSPFFWHPPDQHPYGELQIAARQSSRKCPGSAPAFLAAYNHPELIPVAAVRNEAPAEQLAIEATSFALSHDASDPSGDCLRPGRTGQARFIDQPAIRVGCAPRGCHHGYAPGSHCARPLRC